MTIHEEKAVELFYKGYNCAQSVFAAFCDVTGMAEAEALRLSSSFGGGIGRLREVCGAVSGMLMAAGVLYGYDDPEDPQQKAEHYARVRALAQVFREQHGSIVCRELLQGRASAGGTPSVRTEEFYRDRPCLRLVGSAAAILDGYLAEHPPLHRSADGA